MKWSMPHFVTDGKILCSMAAFKEHAAFGFWHREMEKELGRIGDKCADAMGSFGRITSVKDLPHDATMIRLLKRAAEINASGEPGRPRPKAKKPARELPVPSDLAAGLKKKKSAADTFRELSPSQRKEYIVWITEAKRDETRQSRLATTLKWLAEGKPRNWKYL